MENLTLEKVYISDKKKDGTPLKTKDGKRKRAKENIYFNGKGNHSKTMYDLLFNNRDSG